MASKTKITFPGGVLVTAYVLVTNIVIDRVQRQIGYMLQGFRDEDTRRKFSAAIQSLIAKQADYAAAQDAVRAAASVPRPTEQDKAIDRDAALGAAQAKLHLAQSHLQTAASAINDADIQPCWRSAQLILSAEATAAALSGNNIDDAIASIYEELKQPGGLLAGSEDI